VLPQRPDPANKHNQSNEEGEYRPFPAPAALTPWGDRRLEAKLIRRVGMIRHEPSFV
jgi:hypothetical protein